jgi:hypothetical protein
MRMSMMMVLAAASIGAAFTWATMTEARDPVAGSDATARQNILYLGGCFRVSYQFVEDGKNDFFLRDALVYIKVEERRGGFDVYHYVPHGGSSYHDFDFTEEWRPAGSGRWTQRVTTPRGGLRYQGTGAWIFNQWEAHAFNADRPTRDEHRDYDMLDRRNTVQITPQRWVQMESNVKRQWNGTLVASEVGWVQYERVPNEQCTAMMPAGN